VYFYSRICRNHLLWKAASSRSGKCYCLNVFVYPVEGTVFNVSLPLLFEIEDASC
jgi:hypothetical protein